MITIILLNPFRNYFLLAYVGFTSAPGHFTAGVALLGFGIEIEYNRI